jgi:hypothetical protein
MTEMACFLRFPFIFSGRSKEMAATYLAEDYLDESRRRADEEAFTEFFGRQGSNPGERESV